MIRKFFFGTLAIALAVMLTTAAVQAQPLAPYSQDFEGLVQSDPGALAGDGWLVFGNEFDALGGYLGGYGPFPAPNGGSGFSGIDIGQGGPDQGAQQMVVYNDYNNFKHSFCGGAPLDPTSPTCVFIEANVFQEQRIGAVDVGSTWIFEFDAKRGNIEGVTEAKAFIKTLDPNNFSLSNFIWIDMTNVPETWGRYSLSIDIDPGLVNHILQIGFLSYTTAYQPSGIFYDNIEFLRGVSLDIKPGSCPNPINKKAKGVLPVAVLGTQGLDVNDIDVASLKLEGVAPIRYGYEDVAAPYTGDLCGCTEAGPDSLLDLTLKFRNQDIVKAIGASPNGDVVLTLTGMLLDGTPIEGQDCVFTLAGGQPSYGELGVQPGSMNFGALEE